MLADDAALRALVTGPDALAERLAPDGIHVSMSTVSPATTRELADYHAKHGSVMIAAPVFGRPNNAEAKQLQICVSGSADAKAKAKPLLEAMGQRIFDFGDNIGAANVVKISGNFMIAAAIEAMGEVVAMVRKSGVDPVATLDMLTTDDLRRTGVPGLRPGHRRMDGSRPRVFVCRSDLRISTSCWRTR